MKLIPTWDDVTVQQFLDIYKLNDSSLSEMDKIERVICILFDLTQQQVDDMPMSEFTQKCRIAGFTLNTPIPEKPVRYIKVGKRKYAITYDPTKLRHRQYVELMTYGTNPTENMHLIMASIVEPVNWYGRKLKNNVDDHAAIASDMLQAKVVDVHNANVFFCKLYVSLIANIKDYLVSQMMMNSNMTREKSESLIMASINAMAGFIPQKNWQPSMVKT